jgi:hypothetical protein
METNEKNRATQTALNEETLAADAYERVKAELAALAPEELAQVNLDVTSAVTTILGVLPEIRALRQRIAKELSTFDLTAFDKLEDYALALKYAHTGYLTATQPPDDLPALSTQAAKLRERLLADAQSLAHYGLVDGGQLAQMKGANGNKNVAQDLEILSKVLQQNWQKFQGKSPVTADDLQTAARLSTRLLRIVGVREQGPAILAEATEQRMRAFTRVLQVYEAARLAIGYLRAREGDAETIVPSLYGGRPRRRSSSDTSTEVPVGNLGAPAPGAAQPSESPAVPAVPSAAPAPGATGAKTAVNSQDPFLS